MRPRHVRWAMFLPKRIRNPIRPSRSPTLSASTSQRKTTVSLRRCSPSSSNLRTAGWSRSFLATSFVIWARRRGVEENQIRSKRIVVDGRFGCTHSSTVSDRQAFINALSCLDPRNTSACRVGLRTRSDRPPSFIGQRSDDHLLHGFECVRKSAQHRSHAGDRPPAIRGLLQTLREAPFSRLSQPEPTLSYRT
jgi:hypothetical protein